ncbi:MATH and LRR domain-containing protein PFE0570w isoform X4 [Hydra vulgaris]
MKAVLFFIILTCASCDYSNRQRRQADVVYARCNDVYPQCLSWKEQQNWCTSDQYREYMATVCPLTCGFCVKEDPIPDPVPIKSEPSPEQTSQDEYKKQMQQYYTDIQRLQGENSATQVSSAISSNTSPATTTEQLASYVPAPSPPAVDLASIYSTSPVNPDPQSIPATSEVQSVPTATIFSYPPAAPPASPPAVTSISAQVPQVASAPVYSSPSVAQAPQNVNQSPVQPLLNYAPLNPVNASVTFTAAIGQNVTALKAPINTLMMGQLIQNENDSKVYNPKLTSSALYSEKKPQKEESLQSPKNASNIESINTVKEITPQAMVKDKEKLNTDLKEGDRPALKIEKVKPQKKITNENSEDDEATNEQIRTESKHLEKNLSQAKEKRLRAELQAKAKKLKSAKKIDIEEESGDSSQEQLSKKLNSFVPKIKHQKTIQSRHLKNRLKNKKVKKLKLKKKKLKSEAKFKNEATTSSKHFSEFLKTAEENDLEYNLPSEKENVEESGSESGIGAEGEFEDALAKDLEELSFITGLNFDDDDYDVADDISNEIQNLDSKKKTHKISVKESSLFNAGASTKRNNNAHHVNVARSHVPIVEEDSSYMKLKDQSTKSNIPSNNQLATEESSDEDENEINFEDDDNSSGDSSDKKSKVLYKINQSVKPKRKAKLKGTSNIRPSNSDIVTPFKTRGKKPNAIISLNTLKFASVTSQKPNITKSLNASSKSASIASGKPNITSSLNVYSKSASVKTRKPNITNSWNASSKSRKPITNSWNVSTSKSANVATQTIASSKHKKLLNLNAVKNNFKLITAVKGSRLIVNSKPNVTVQNKLNLGLMNKNTQSNNNDNSSNLEEGFNDEYENALSSFDDESGSASGGDSPGVLPSVKENSNNSKSPADILATSEEGKLIKVISKAGNQEGKISFVLKQNFNSLLNNVHSPNYMMLSGNVKKDLEKALVKGKIEDITFSEADIEGNPRQTGKTKVSFNIKSRESLIRILMKLVDTGSINGLAVVKGSMEYDDK